MAICSMLWKQTLSELVNLGLKQSEIAERIESTQGYISALVNGKATNPSAAIAAKLDALLAKERRRAAKPRKTKAGA
jgi:transcriptional regulator with XRE-family HTH domain